MTKTCVVTGGSGFIGAFLVKRLVRDGWNVTVVDNMTRGDASRLSDVVDQITIHTCDVRDEAALTGALKGADVVFHLAAVNGTENFYTHPELVLDVGLRGALSVVNAMRTVGVPDLVVASSAEAYQTPEIIPTDETVALKLPDSQNPRYSYAGSKIVSELIAFNYGKDYFRKVQVFRPHNVYGPDMGWKHVIPQMAQRALAARESGDMNFPIQGTGEQTRAFAYVDDVVDGIVRMYQFGEHREIYNIGTDHEIEIREVARMVGDALGLSLNIVATPEADGGPLRRCPDISKIRTLGYEPRTGLKDGIRKTVAWYAEQGHDVPVNELS